MGATWMRFCIINSPIGVAPLLTYDNETRQAIASLKGKIDTYAAIEIWENAIATKWTHSPIWIHGDISIGNLLVQSG